MSMKIRTALALFTLSLSGTSSAIQYEQAAMQDEKAGVITVPKYAGRINFANIRTNPRIDTAVFVANASSEATTYFESVRRILPIYAPNIQKLVVILEGFVGEKDGKKFNDLKMASDVFHGLGATLVLRGEDSSGGRDPYYVGLSTEYKGEIDPAFDLPSAREYLLKSDHSRSIYLESGASLSMAMIWELKLPWRSQFAQGVYIHAPNLVEAVARMFLRKQEADLGVPMSEVSRAKAEADALDKANSFKDQFIFSSGSWGSHTQNFSKDKKKPESLNIFRDSEAYLADFFTELKRVQLAPFEKSMADFMQKQSECLAKKNIEKMQISKEEQTSLFMAMAGLSRLEGHALARRCAELMGKYNISEVDFKRMAGDCSADLNLTGAMILSFVEFLITQVEGQEIISVLTGGTPIYENIGKDRSVIIGYKGGQSTSKKWKLPGLSGPDKMMALRQLYADLFTGTVYKGPAEDAPPPYEQVRRW